jgi:hypothetical protein
MSFEWDMNQQTKKMKKQVSILIKRLFGKVTVYSKSSAIHGTYSEGRRDLGGVDWNKTGF